MNMKREIITELEHRIKKLEKHEFKEHDNEFRNLNSALSNVLSTTLKSELEDIKNFVERLD